MKTTIKAKVVIEDNRYMSVYYNETGGVITLDKIKQSINNGDYEVEWVNSELCHEQEPTIIFKLKGNNETTN